MSAGAGASEHASAPAGRGAGRSVDADLVVLGAGPAGLGAAYRAARAGHRVVVLEREDRVGGAAGSITVAGQRVDLGSHRLHPATAPAVLDDLRALLGDALQRRVRHGRIRLSGRWVGFPLRPLDAARNLPPSFVAAAAWDAASSWARRPRADTFAERLRASLGPTMCTRFYFPYAHKLWGLPPERIAGVQARRRVSADSPLKLVRRVLSPDPDRRSFYYPRRGFGQIAETLAEAAVQAGAQVRLGSAAEQVVLDGDRVQVRVASGATVTAARVWSTVPVTVLARLVDPPPPPEVTAAARSLRFRSMVLVYLVVDAPRYTEFDAHYLPEATTPVTRVSEPKNYRDGDDPADRTVLCAEVPCDRHDPVWAMSADELGALVQAALADAGLPAPAVAEVHTHRLSHAYPVYEVGFEPHFAALDAWAADLPRLLTFGRQALFVHDNSHHALAMAWAAADALRADGGFDAAAWQAARRRFDEHVVED